MIWLDVDTAVETIVNAVALTNSTDFESRDETIAYNESGMELYWNFITSAGAASVTAVTPTTGGVYDWSHVDGAMYKMEIPASGGGTINNDTEGYGWWSGKADGILSFSSPVYGFRASGLNDLMTDNAYSTTRGLAGTALPAAAADAAGGLPISDAGGLDMDAILADTTSLNDTKIPQTLNLTASGNIGIDWANVENPSTAVDLSATDIQLVDTTTTNTDMRGTDSAFLAANAPTNFSDLSITATTGRVDVASIEGSDATDQIGDAVWDEPLAAHTTGDTPGNVLNMLTQDTVTLSTDVALGSIIGQLLDAGTSWSYDRTTDSLEVLGAGGTAPSAASIADAVWDEAASGHTSAGTFGAQCGTDIDAILVDTAEIGAAGVGLTAIPWNAAWDAEVQSEVNDGLVALGLDHLVVASVTGTDITDNSIIAYMVSKSATADWDSFVNTTDALEALADASAPTAAAIADAVWDEAASGHVAAGSFGAQCGTDIDAILADTNELQTDDVPGLIAALNNISTAQVNAQVADVINTDTYAEVSGGAPTDTPTLSEMIRELYFAWKNKKTVTSSTLTIRNSADSADLHTAPLSDDTTTFTKGELGA